jgi:hypothetical protein
VSVEITWNGARVNQVIDEALLRGLWLAALHLLAESQRIVPLEEATLERSGTASIDRSQFTAAVSYDTVYAVRQHEELTWRHDPGRTAKYLEAPMHTQQAIMLAIIAGTVRKAMAA